MLEKDIEEFRQAKQELMGRICKLELDLAKELENVIKPVLQNFHDRTGHQISNIDLRFREYRDVFQGETEYTFEFAKVNLALRKLL